MYVYEPLVCMVHFEDRRGRHISRNWSYRCLYACEQLDVGAGEQQEFVRNRDISVIFLVFKQKSFTSIQNFYNPFRPRKRQST